MSQFNIIKITKVPEKGGILRTSRTMEALIDCEFVVDQVSNELEPSLEAMMVCYQTKKSPYCKVNISEIFRVLKDEGDFESLIMLRKDLLGGQFEAIVFSADCYQFEK